MARIKIDRWCLKCQSCRKKDEKKFAFNFILANSEDIFLSVGLSIMVTIFSLVSFFWSYLIKYYYSNYDYSQV